MKRHFIWSIWTDLVKDCKAWCKTCIPCQKSKVHRHTKSPLHKFPLPDARFSHINIDIVGPLPPSQDYRFLLTCIDRYTKLPEAIPLKDQTAESVAKALYANWIARFGVPEVITSDRGTNFESNLFASLSKLLGVRKIRTTSYHPISNGLVERLHRQLKAAIKCHSTERWSETLPTILLGIRSCIKNGMEGTAAEMVYGAPLKLPGEFFRNSSAFEEPCLQEDFVKRLRFQMRQLRPASCTNHSLQNVFVHKDLLTTSHVFVRTDAVRKPLEQPYKGPFKVLSRSDKSFVLDLDGRKDTVSIDRLKPAFVLQDFSSENSTSRSSTAIAPNVSPSTEATKPQQVTRSGRRVKFVDRFCSSK